MLHVINIWKTNNASALISEQNTGNMCNTYPQCFLFFFSKGSTLTPPLIRLVKPSDRPLLKPLSKAKQTDVLCTQSRTVWRAKKTVLHNVLLIMFKFNVSSYFRHAVFAFTYSGQFHFRQNSLCKGRSILHSSPLKSVQTSICQNFEYILVFKHIKTYWSLLLHLKSRLLPSSDQKSLLTIQIYDHSVYDRSAFQSRMCPFV